MRSISVLILKSIAGKKLPHNLSEIRPLDRPDISFGVCDSMVAEAIYWFGIQGYEGLMSKVWIELCSRSKNILEIGGNIGIYSVVGGYAASGRYVVVEPVPEVAALLRNNIFRNSLTEKVILIEAAVIPGNDVRSVALSVPAEGRDAPVGAHLSIATEMASRITEKLINVRGEPFSELIRKCDLIKIDAEGIEELLLSSVRDYLVSNKPTLVIEVLPEAKNLAKFLAQFALETGMKIYVIPAYGIQSITEISPSSFTSTTPVQFNSKDVVISKEEIF